MPCLEEKSSEEEREPKRTGREKERLFPFSTPSFVGRARKNLKTGSKYLCDSTSVLLPLVRKVLMRPVGHILVIWRITRRISFLQVVIERMRMQTSNSSSSNILEMCNRFLINGYGKKIKHAHVHTVSPPPHPQLPYIQQGKHKVVIQGCPSSSVSCEHLVSLSFQPLV